jgi:hypothetical protein
MQVIQTATLDITIFIADRPNKKYKTYLSNCISEKDFVYFIFALLSYEETQSLTHVEVSQYDVEVKIPFIGDSITIDFRDEQNIWSRYLSQYLKGL